MRLLLLKAQTKIAGQAGYQLINGRWHSVHKGKKAPKNAPKAADPKALGSFEPKQHLSDTEWGLLHLPETNSNAKSYANKLAELKEYSDSGNVAAILGMPIGTNTYGKKLAIVANHLLSQYGTKHKVAAGQKAGEHEAVKAQESKVEPAKQTEPTKEKAKPKQTDKSALAMPTFIEGKTTNTVVSYYEGVSQKILDMAASGDLDGLEKMKADGLVPNAKGKVSHTFKGKTDNSKTLLGLHQAAIDQLATDKTEALPKAEPEAKTKADPKPKPSKQDKADLVAKMNAAAEQVDTGVTDKLTAAINEDAKTKLAMINWDKQLLPDSNTNAKSHNGKVAAIKAMAESGDIEALEAFKAGKNTYGKKQNLLAQTALAALKESQSEAATEPVAEPEPAKAANPPPAAPAMKGITSQVASKMWFKMASDGEMAKLKESLLTTAANAGEKPEAFNSDDGLSLLKYATELSAWVNESEGGSGKGLSETFGKVYDQVSEKAKAPEEAGPKDGDTKQGAEGMLVFKDGHWHKQDEAPAASDGPAVPEYSGSNKNHNELITKASQALKDKVLAEGKGAFKGALTSHKDGSFSLKIAGIHIKKASPNSTNPIMADFAQFASELKEFAGVVKPQPKAKPEPMGKAIESMDSWTQTGAQGGSNPGGKFKDAAGTEWYCKFPDDADVAKSEVLAAKLYSALGLSAQNAKLITKDGKVGIASLWKDVTKVTAKDLASSPGALSGFAADAWLANWDVVGMGFDNLQLDASGHAMRIDAGGSLEYRAQGSKKPFGDTVGEIQSMMDASINPQSAAVFGKMSKADISASVSKVLALSDTKIAMLVMEHGPGSLQDKQSMIKTLIARKADLAKQFPKAVKDKKKPTFDPSKISAPPDFNNWGGPGQSGPSSKDFLNQANHAAVLNIQEAAQTGSQEAVSSLSEPVYNKSTGEVDGHAPVLEHPSQHVKGYAKQVINEIESQLNPPKRFRLSGEHPLNALNVAYPAAASQINAKMLGKFIDLGKPGVIDLESLGMPKLTFEGGALTTQTYVGQAHEAIGKMPQTQVQALKAYTGSGYKKMNSSLWSGNPSGQAKAATEALHTLAHDIKPGTVLSRKLSLSDSHVEKLIKATGKVLQEPAIMSTSIRPSSWSGNVQIKMHVGPGVKGLWVGNGSMPGGGALSSHAGEDEMILPPNTRLLILSSKQTAGKDADGFGSSTLIEALILPSEGY